MKKIFLPIAICASALFAASCQGLLEEPQKGVVSYDEFYKTDEDAEGAMVAAYDKFAQNIARPNGESIICPFIALFTLPGDDVYAAGEFFGDNDFNGQINEFRFDADAQLVTSMYKGLYQMIYGANLVIDHFGGELADSPVKKRVTAEARVMRAWAHMVLAIHWGCPPLVDHVLTGDVKPMNCDVDPDVMMSHNDLLEWCAKECLESVADLRERSSVSDKDATTYITKGFANFVAGKALVFAGKYSDAKAPLKALINSGKYSLVPSDRIRETFHIVGEGNEEIIFASNVNNNPAIGDWNGKINKSVWMHMDIWGWRMDHCAGKPVSVRGGWGGLGVRQDFAEALIANDGWDSPRRKAWVKKFDPEVLYEMDYGSIDKPVWTDPKSPKYVAGRPAYIAKLDSIGLNKDGTTKYDTTFTDSKKKDINRGIKSYLYGQSEYVQYKRVSDETDYDNWYSCLNTLVARYAEALLLYAEACAQTNDNDGLQYLNAIQNRAGSAHVSSQLTMDEVKNEKKFEMFMEGTRFADMVRWGDTAGVVNNGKDVPQIYDAMFVGQDDPKKTEDEHRIYTVMQHPNAGKTTGFQAGKHELFPYPGSAVMAINENMVQNPGY